MTDLPEDPSPVTGIADAAIAPDPAALEHEYRQMTTAAGVLDRSASGKLALTGKEARTFLAGQVTADVEALTPGVGVYAALLTPKGKIVCDLRILDVSGDDEVELLLLCERSGLQALFDHLRRHLIGFEAELHKRTLQSGLLSLIGPRSEVVAGELARGVDAAEHAHAAGRIDDLDVRAIRTDVGLDLVCPAADTDALHAALIARGATSVQEDAAEILRVESGRPRLHHELNDQVMPAEGGIVERAVSFTKGCYVGQETVARLHWRGRPNRHLRGLALDRSVASGTVLVEDGRELGRVTTSVVSPRLGPIALALVRREVEPDRTVVLRPAVGGPTSARVVRLPFSGPDAPYPTA